MRDGLVLTGDALVIRNLLRRDVQLKGQHVLRSAESGLDSAQLSEALKHQPGGNEEHEDDGNLQHGHSATRNCEPLLEATRVPA